MYKDEDEQAVFFLTWFHTSFVWFPPLDLPRVRYMLITNGPDQDPEIFKTRFGMTQGKELISVEK